MTNVSEKKPNEMMRGVLYVKRSLLISPHCIRIILTGKDIANFKNAKVGDNNKLAIPKEQNKIFDVLDLKQKEKLKENFHVRTYTLRALDLEKEEMVIDFVAHSDEGPASYWAIHAKKGDAIGVMMKVKNKSLYTEANRYFLLGDHTALPVISVILETLPNEAEGEVFLEVFDESDMLDLKKPENVKINWIEDNHPGLRSSLVKTIKKIEFREGDFVFAACEHGFANQIQSFLRGKTLLERKNWQVHAYWKYGVSEDASSAERKLIRQK